MRRVLLLLIALSLVISRVTITAAAQRCFTETVFCLESPFSEYWSQHGGLPVFGFPIVREAREPNPETGTIYLMQWIERNRFELHPENAGTPYEVLLGLLGKERLRQLGRNPEPREAGAQPGCLWFEQTGHNVCDQATGLGFKSYWQSHGLNIGGLSAYDRSLQLFGLPLTGVNLETNSAGDTVQTQWFERARFEWHPGKPDEYKVLLGLLGKETIAGYGIGGPVLPQPPTQPQPSIEPQPQPTTQPQPTNEPQQPSATPAPQPTATPTLPPPTFDNCRVSSTSAPNNPVTITSLDKRSTPEQVTIKNVSSGRVVIDGWRICSANGAQLHATLSGTLAVGESRDIESQAEGPVWNNTNQDDAALYDASGRLIAYFVDPN